MSGVASITFPFDGTKQHFLRLYDAVCDLDLDIGAYAEGRTGVVEFMIDDFTTFKEDVATRSAKLGVDLIAHDYLLSEPKT